MFQKAGFKIFVILFSLTAGGVFIWHSGRELSGKVSDRGEPGKNEGSPKRPLMSGSKTRSEMLMEVDEAWELAVPPLEEKAKPMEGE